MLFSWLATVSAQKKRRTNHSSFVKMDNRFRQHSGSMGSVVGDLHPLYTKVSHITQDTQHQHSRTTPKVQPLQQWPSPEELDYRLVQTQLVFVTSSTRRNSSSGWSRTLQMQKLVPRTRRGGLSSVVDGRALFKRERHGIFGVRPERRGVGLAVVMGLKVLSQECGTRLGQGAEELRRIDLGLCELRSCPRNRHYFGCVA